MKILFRLFFACAFLLVAVAGRAEATKPGYNVVVETTYDEKGIPVSAKVVESDDFSGDQTLNQVALKLAGQVKETPHQKDGQPVKFTVRVPFNFPVEGDEGPAANDAPRPHIIKAIKPHYPAALADAGVVGGAILELVVGADGNLKSVRTLRASHQEFGIFAEDAVSKWAFRPALKDGQPVESRWRLAMTFALDKTMPDWRWRYAPRPSLGEWIAGHPRSPAPPAAPGTQPPASGPAQPAPVEPTPAPAK